jgi:hypothetical protein
MTVAAPSAIRDAIVAHVKPLATSLNGRITAEPPEGPPAGLQAWLDYGPVEFEWGLMNVAMPQVVITVATNRKGHYPGEYRTVTDAVHEVWVALQGALIFADEGIVTGLTVGRAGSAVYAGTEIVAATITITLEMKQQNVAAGD